MQKIISKDNLSGFINTLMKDYDVIAPVKNINTRFKKITSPSEIYLDKLTDVPAKKYFLPENEILFKYKDGKIIENTEKIKKRIIFGLRLCDLNALEVIDKIMPCSLYLDKRKNTITIGVFCSNPDEYCFCNSMALNENVYDLFLYPSKKDYIIDVRSKSGESLVKDLPTLKKEIHIPRPKNTKKLNSLYIDRHYRNKIWESDSEKCLSCSACTINCPTCNCFDIKDTLEINLKDGIRSRHEMSCQLKSFSRVAGGKSYRDSRLSRFKHFVYHKIVYYKKRKGRYMCVGCGRCLRVCPTKIDWVNTINLLEDLKNPKSKLKFKQKKIIKKR